MSMKKSTVAMLLASLTLSGGAIAQNAGQPGSQPVQPEAVPAAPAVRPPPPMPTWADADLAKFGDALAGSWKTTAPVAQAGDAGASADVVMHVAPVTINELPNAMYVETARADSMYAPYRQAIFQLYKSRGKVRMRTLEVTGFQTDRGSLVGMWAIPNYFPADLPRSVMIATMDLELTPSTTGFTGKSPYAYPTDRGGAIEMTSELTVSGSALTVADRGFDADGKVVWGSSEGQQYTFAKFTPTVKVDKRESGLVLVDFVPPGSDQAVLPNDRVTCQYTGWLPTGLRFDTSRTRGNPFTYTQGGLIPGWNEGMLGATKGTIRRLYIPWELGYGERGNPRAQIPARADLVFEVEVMHVETPPPPPPPTEVPPNAGQNPGGQPGTQPAGGGQPNAQVNPATGRTLPPFVKWPEGKEPPGAIPGKTEKPAETKPADPPK